MSASSIARVLKRLRWWSRARGVATTEEHIRDERARESFPYVVEYGIPLDFAFPHGFDCARFRGLRYCEVLATTSRPPTAKLVAFWRDRESFERQAPAIEGVLGQPPLLWQGYQDQVEARGKPKWWKNTATVYLLAVHTVAVIGTVEALRSHYAELFGAGNVHLFTREAQYDLLEGQPFRLTYKVRNIGMARTALALASPRVVSVGAVAGGDALAAPSDCALARAGAAPPSDRGVTLRDEVREIPDITVGEIEEIVVSGVARRAGRYCLAVDGKAESGMVRRLVLGDADFHTDLSLRVWPRFGIDVRAARVDANRCAYLVTLSSGVAFADGLGMSAELQGVADAEFRFVQGAALVEAQRPRAVRTPGAEVSGLDWLTHPLPAMKDTTLTLDLRAPGATEEACASIGRRIRIRSFSAKEFNR
jgi:hypothetical protein